MKRTTALGLCACSLLALFGTAQAAEEGDWIVRVGAHDVDPKSNNHSLVSVDSDVQLTFDFSYLFTDNWAIEVLAAIPFEHDISIDGLGVVGSTKHLPPTISMQYRFDIGDGTVTPYLGAGLNYTIFSSEELPGLGSPDLDLDSSTGLALQVGFDIEFSDRMIFNAVLRSLDIDTDATVDGTPIGTVEVDPIALGIGIGWVF